ncbi:gamma-glutamylcyclotransferase family protein [Novispirillum sp. DQ9]|uniref:gamma-glutamylcyclotransferase family protein n=1 Tax=Novispirillum sp. DQ9 TaxID=3398612 RepID=UPI003C7B889F
MGTLPTRHQGPLFVFGSLLDDDILHVVLGPAAMRSLTRQPAHARGFHRRRVHGEPFPMLVPHPAPAEAVVDGALLHGLDGEAWSRLRFYEGPGYALHPLEVEAVEGTADGRERRRRCPARVFLATERLRDSGHPWDLGHWRRTEKPLALLMAHGLMALYGKTGPEGPPDAVWEDIKARCRARLAGDQPSHAGAWGA